MCWSATVILFLRGCSWLPGDSACGSVTCMGWWHRLLLNVNKSANWGGERVTQALPPIFISQRQPELRLIHSQPLFQIFPETSLKFPRVMRKRNTARWHLKLYDVEENDETNAGAGKTWWKLSSPKVLWRFAKGNKRLQHYFTNSMVISPKGTFKLRALWRFTVTLVSVSQCVNHGLSPVSTFPVRAIKVVGGRLCPHLS